jgi:hypothetical protein
MCSLVDGEVLERLSRAYRLLKPLRYFPFAAPDISRRASVASGFLSNLVLGDCSRDVVDFDTNFSHTATQVGDYAVALSFVHCDFLI